MKSYKGLAALVAGVWLDSGMHPQVRPQAEVHPEALATLLALEGLLVRVDHAMSDEADQLAETFPAVLTGVRLDTLMSLLVPPQSDFTQEAFPTHLTGEGIFYVCFAMTFQIGQGLAGPFAVRTGE